MASSEHLHGGLVFYTSKNEQGLETYCRIVSAVLEDHDHIVERQSIQTDGRARVTTARIAVDLHLDLNEERPRLEVELTTAGPGSVDEEHARLLLLVMLYRMIEAYPARIVEWLSPEVELPTARFLAAFGNVSPRRVHSRPRSGHADAPRFESVESEAVALSDQCEHLMLADEPDVEAALAHAFRDEAQPEEIDAIRAEEAENDIRRLTAWGMTGMVALLSGPVGLSMAAVNLVKGEDFRLNTHVLAMTAFVGAVTSTSTMAHATETVVKVVSHLPF